MSKPLADGRGRADPNAPARRHQRHGDQVVGTRRLRRVAETPARSAESVTVTRRSHPLGVGGDVGAGTDQAPRRPTSTSEYHDRGARRDDQRRRSAGPSRRWHPRTASSSRVGRGARGRRVEAGDSATMRLFVGDRLAATVTVLVAHVRLPSGPLPTSRRRRTGWPDALETGGRGVVAARSRRSSARRRRSGAEPREQQAVGQGPASSSPVSRSAPGRLAAAALPRGRTGSSRSVTAWVILVSGPVVLGQPSLPTGVITLTSSWQQKGGVPVGPCSVNSRAHGHRVPGRGPAGCGGRAVDRRALEGCRPGWSRRG